MNKKTRDELRREREDARATAAGLAVDVGIIARSAHRIMRGRERDAQRNNAQRAAAVEGRRMKIINILRSAPRDAVGTR